MASRTTWRLVGASIGIALLGLTGYLIAGTSAKDKIGLQPDGSYRVSTNQIVSPLGRVFRFEYHRPKDLALSPDKQLLALYTTDRVVILDREGKQLGEVKMKTAPLGVVWSPDGKTIYASGNNANVVVIEKQNDEWKPARELQVDAPANKQQVPSKRNPQVTGLAISGDGKTLYAVLSIRNSVVTVDTASGRVQDVLNVGVAPYRIILSPDQKTLVVTNRGGEHATITDYTEETVGTPIKVDPKTDAAIQGSISLIDVSTLKIRNLVVGRQPSSAAFLTDNTFVVSNSDEDNISFVDLAKGEVFQTVPINDEPGAPFGHMPTDLAFDPSSSRLYITCGGVNAVRVLECKPERVKPLGYFPTGWYPIAIAGNKDTLYVASAKGIGSQPSDKTTKFHVRDSVGTLQIVKRQELSDLKTLTKRVASLNAWKAELKPRKNIKPVPVPVRVGEPSVFKYVVYIIKENLPYDMILGDMKEGNGEPSLCVFPEPVSPNQHALARQFVLLDNTYTSGTNSADGHQWSASSICNAYQEQNFASNIRSYPYDGRDPLAYSPKGFIWNAAERRGLGLRVYGEFIDEPTIVDRTTGKRPSWTQLWKERLEGTNKYEITADTSLKALKPYIHPNFIGFPSIVSDQYRADLYLKEFDMFEKTDKMPALTVMLLPNNHTNGSQPGMPTPSAMVADNDLALGRIVERISHSKFWKETLILVIEDDSQTGLDHVDGHRTIAQVISPYTRRGAVVSDIFNHTSFIRTIGLVLGMPPLNRFDQTATPLTSCFTDKPNFTPFIAKQPAVALDEMNPDPKALKGRAKELAIACDKLDWAHVDKADATTVSQAVWHSVHPNKPFPWQHFRAHVDKDDDD